MPVLMSLLGPLGSMILKMVMASFTGDILKLVIEQALEMAIKKYERKALETEDKADDDKAAAYREAFELLKSKWDKL